MSECGRVMEGHFLCAGHYRAVAGAGQCLRRRHTGPGGSQTTGKTRNRDEPLQNEHLKCLISVGR